MRRCWLILCLLASVAAQAGERPLAPPTPATGLRDCAGGGIILPGSRTCLHLGGSVRAEATTGFGEGHTARDTAGTRRSLTHFGTEARIALDARTPTDMGPLRVYVEGRSRMPDGGFGR